ncbi:hypothetical protein MKX03_022307 [Papaver bracteatum]|nr:hypothetical protein MKX03_022307 [Papaver bracteatum]
MSPIKVGDVMPDGTLDHQLWCPRCFYPYLHHIPSFITNDEELKSTGVAEILLVSINDPCQIYGSATYINALGFYLDLGGKGLGICPRRFALSVDDLKVKVANIEEGGAFTLISPHI